MDGELRRRLDSAVDEAFPDAEIYRDRTGLAVYQVRPAWATLVLCGRCLTLALLPALPRVLRPKHPCSGCSAVIVLEPPREVLEVQGIDLVNAAILRVQ